MRKTIKGSKKIITRMTAFVLSLILLFGWEIGSYADNFDAETIIAEAITTVDDTEDTLDTISFDEIEDVQVEDLGDFDDAAKEFDGVVDDTLNNADTANTSEDKDEAFEAKEKAEDNLSDAKTKLDDAVTAYEEAGKAIDEVEGKITDAEKAYTEAAEALEKAGEDNAQAKIDLEEALARIAKEEDNKERLEAIQDQYYAMMVYYYRALNGRDKAIYDEKGILDIEANRELLTDEQIDKFAAKGDDKFFLLGRDLTGKLVEYMIINGDANEEDPQFKFGYEGKDEKEAQEAVLFKNKKNLDQALAGKGEKGTDVNNQTVYANETYTQLWNNSNSHDNGRTNRVAASYIDKDGNEQVRYYNYVLKSSDFEENTDVENGMFYLASIELDENNKWTVNRVVDENNFDDYSKIAGAIAAIKDYTKAKEDAAKALNKIEFLNSRIEALESSKVKQKDRIDALNKEIALAKEALATATATKNELEDAYKEAKEIVEAIDLSRFDIVKVIVPEETPDALTEAPADLPEETTENNVMIIEEAPVILAATAEPVIEAQDEAEEEIPAATEPTEEETSAVVTQTTLTSEPEVANDETDTEAGTEVRTITDEPTATLSAPSSDTTITDEKTALASGKTEKRFNIKNYLWILLLIATTVVASLLYAYYTKKEEEEEASENW